MNIPKIEDYWNLPRAEREKLFMIYGIGYSVIRLIEEDSRMEDLIMSMDLKDRQNIRLGMKF